MMQPQHDYAQVNHHVHHHDDDSSTEVESLVGAEKQWADGEFQHISQRSRRRILCPPLVAALRWVLIIGLQLVVIGLLARDQGLLDSTRFRGKSTSANDPGGDITGWSPHSASTTFHPSSKPILTRNSPNSNHYLQNQPNFRPLQHLRILQTRNPPCLERAPPR
jgi:hypothetical protein